ncbi:MAG TPA: diadenylate cyclase CdaA [Candidatus Acidoferrales bacterium]|nr:diadenylate cyclase CdaA [Candidatus Acidoferrales bacterium]
MESFVLGAAPVSLALAPLAAGLEWATLVDIVVVAVVVYYFLLLIKDTRAYPLLFAGVILLSLYVISQWAQLRTLSWLVSNPAAYFLVLVLLVIYQGEIRRELARLGRLPLLARLTARERGEPYDDIVLASSYFSQNKVGALMVLEREVSLRTYIESGIGLDALLSYDLLVSIFLPQSPLHDGAVIVRKNRVVAASCFLPLSLNPLLSTHLGTRHRAAIGVTEESDAIAVVVSEETGSISVMSAGAVDLNLTPEQLRARLRRLLREAGPRLALYGRGA